MKPQALPNEHLGEREGLLSKPESGWLKPHSFPRLTGYRGEKMLSVATAGQTPRQTPPHPPRLCLPEKNNPQAGILRCQPPTRLLWGPGPARGAHTHPLRSHPNTYTNRAPSTRAHTHRGHAGTAAPLPHKGWRARGHTQPRAGTLAVPSPHRHPAAAHPHPRHSMGAAPPGPLAGAGEVQAALDFLRAPVR